MTDVKRLEEENAKLRKRLENDMEGRRSSGVSLLGLSKYQDLQRDVAKLQAKICKVMKLLHQYFWLVNIIAFNLDGTIFGGSQYYEKAGHIPGDFQVAAPCHGLS